MMAEEHRVRHRLEVETCRRLPLVRHARIVLAHPDRGRCEAVAVHGWPDPRPARRQASRLSSGRAGVPRLMVTILGNSAWPADAARHVQLTGGRGASPVTASARRRGSGEGTSPPSPTRPGQPGIPKLPPLTLRAARGHPSRLSGCSAVASPFQAHRRRPAADRSPSAATGADRHHQRRDPYPQV